MFPNNYNYKKRVEPLHAKDKKSMKAIEKAKEKKLELKLKSPTKANDKESNQFKAQKSSIPACSNSSTISNIVTCNQLNPINMVNKGQTGNPGIARMNHKQEIRKTTATVTRRPIYQANKIPRPHQLHESILIINCRNEIENILKRKQLDRKICTFVFTKNGLWVQANENEPPQHLVTVDEFLVFYNDKNLAKARALISQTKVTPTKRLSRTQLKSGTNVRK